MSYLKKIISLLSFSERKHAFLLLIMIFVSALLDTLGVASILPFVTVLSNPDIIENNIILSKMFNALKIFGVEDSQTFLFALGILVFVLLVVSLIFKATTLYLEVKFAQMQEYNIGKRLVEGYLRQPYCWFLNRNTADFGKTILSEVNQVVGFGIASLISLIAKGVLCFALIILLVITDPQLTLVIGISLCISYVLIFVSFKKYLKQIGDDRLKNNELRYSAIIEAFGAIKEIKFGRLEQIFINRFAKPAHIYAKKHATASIIGQLPRFALEIIAFGGIMLILLYLMEQKGNFKSALPIISLYAFATYRLMPAVQQIYSSISLITFVGPSLDNLSNELKNLKSIDNNIKINKFSFYEKISLNNLSYQYPNSSRVALNNINIEIKAKTTIGIVGSTGSGKTTFVDIILGLLEAQKGNLQVDGKIIDNKNVRSWQSMIGYVPQQIYLSDDTIAANIGFGLQTKDINNEALINASKIANLHDFVENELPEKYNTTIGERGVRLSGGQRQRIGIARALYHSPEVLILDEATNSLDNQTEKAVMDAVNSLRKNLTIILIAHRINTVKNCDNLFLIESGKIKNQGKFEDLAQLEDSFQINQYNNE